MARGPNAKPVSDSLADIDEESALYRDMVVLDGFVDHYKNLTEKLTLGLQWAADHVDADIVFKVCMLLKDASSCGLVFIVYCAIVTLSLLCIVPL